MIQVIKNLRLLTAAYRAMDHTRCHLVIVGNGPALKEVQQELAQGYRIRLEYLVHNVVMRFTLLLFFLLPGLQKGQDQRANQHNQ